VCLVGSVNTRKVAVDVHGFSKLYQGSRTFLLNLYSALSQIRPDIEIVTFGSHSRPTFGNRHIPLELSSPIQRLIVGPDLLFWRQGIKMAHYQYFCPIFSTITSIITIHDILPITHPQYFSPRFASKFRTMIGISIKRATHINVVSEFTKRALVHNFKLDPRKLTVVPNGVHINLFRQIAQDEARERVLTNYGLRDYVIAIGRIEVRKNIPTLISAVERLRETGYASLDLVIVGSVDTSSGGRCSGTISALSKHWVKHFEGVSDTEKSTLLRGAKALVFPSLAEGFGIPPLEAMAAEVPAIVANRTAHGEIYERSALIFDAEDIEELSEKIKLVITNQELRNHLVKAGIYQAHEFSWTRSAAVFLNSLAI
jgi:glycosyltransferase involved in cell wall biosynthesis